MGNRSRLFTRQARTLCAQATEAFKRFLSTLGNFNRLAHRDDAPEPLEGPILQNYSALSLLGPRVLLGALLLMIRLWGFASPIPIHPTKLTGLAYHHFRTQWMLG